MTDFYTLPDDSKRIVVEQTALKRGLSKQIIEKDLWVSTLLEIIFTLPFAVNAIKDDDLWNTIHHHREVFTYMRDVDYTPDIRDRIVLTPPTEHYQTWANDYSDMQSSMIYGDSVSFDNSSSV